eukprot:s417_g1.t4
MPVLVIRRDAASSDSIPNAAPHHVPRLHPAERQNWSGRALSQGSKRGLTRGGARRSRSRGPGVRSWWSLFFADNISSSRGWTVCVELGRGCSRCQVTLSSLISLVLGARGFSGCSPMLWRLADAVWMLADARSPMLWMLARGCSGCSPMLADAVDARSRVLWMLADARGCSLADARMLSVLADARSRMLARGCSLGEARMLSMLAAGCSRCFDGLVLSLGALLVPSLPLLVPSRAFTPPFGAFTPLFGAFAWPWLCALLACRACSLLASSAAFLLCPRRGLWPFLHVPYLGRASVCYWPVVMPSCFLSFFGPRLCALLASPACMWHFRHYFYLPLLLPFPFSSCSFTRACPPAGSFSCYAPAAFCQPLSPPCSRPFLLLVAGRRLFWLRAAAFCPVLLLGSLRAGSGFSGYVPAFPFSSLRPGGGFFWLRASHILHSFSGYVPAAFCPGALRAGGGFSGYVPAAFCQVLCSRSGTVFGHVPAAFASPSLPPSLLFPPGNLVCIMLDPLEPFAEGGHDVIGAALRCGGGSAWAAAAAAASHFHSIPFHSPAPMYRHRRRGHAAA